MRAALQRFPQRLGADFRAGAQGSSTVQGAGYKSRQPQKFKRSGEGNSEGKETRSFKEDFRPRPRRDWRTHARGCS